MGNRSLLWWAVGTLRLCLGTVARGQSFVDFESPHVHPIDVTPGGGTVPVANTADNRPEILVRARDGSLRRSRWAWNPWPSGPSTSRPPGC